MILCKRDKEMGWFPRPQFFRQIIIGADLYFFGPIESMPTHHSLNYRIPQISNYMQTLSATDL